VDDLLSVARGDALVDEKPHQRVARGDLDEMGIGGSRSLCRWRGRRRRRRGGGRGGGGRGGGPGGERREGGDWGHGGSGGGEEGGDGDGRTEEAHGRRLAVWGMRIPRYPLLKPAIAGIAGKICFVNQPLIGQEAGIPRGIGMTPEG